MKKSRYSEEQVIGALKQMESGRQAREVARELGVSEAQQSAWKSKYGGLEVSEARRLRDLEQERGSACQGNPGGRASLGLDPPPLRHSESLYDGEGVG